jgi:peroxiredoxin
VSKDGKFYHLSLNLVLLACLFIGCSYGPDTVDSRGQPIRIADYKGRWVVISFWASWCQPCMIQIDSLNYLHQYYKDKVVVIGVNADHLANPVLQQLKQSYGVKYILVSNFPIAKWGIKELPDIPVTFLIDPTGKLVKTLTGPQSFQNLQNIMNLPPITYNGQ